METQSDDMATLLFTNLQLLGMDVVAMEEKYHIPFNKDMFNLPNKAGSEAVLQFLFHRLSPALFKQYFRDCWPVLDRKAELQFRKVCNTWLSTIHTNNPEAYLPRINASLLLSPGGRKYIHLLYRFSTFVLLQTMTKEHGYNAQDGLVYPVLNKTNSAYGEVMKSALEDSCRQLHTFVFEELHLNVAANRKWKESADELIKAYRQQSRASRDLDNEKRPLVSTLADNAQKQGLSLPAKRTVSMFDSDQDIYSANRGKRMEKARSQWKQLTDFCGDMADKREVIKSILDPDADKPSLNGTSLGIRIPNLLLQDFQREIQAQEIDNVYIGGRLNLESVAQLWIMCLRRYKEQIAIDTPPDLSGEIPTISTQVHQHHGHLRAAQRNRDEIKNSMLPKLQREMEKLNKKMKNLLSVSGGDNKSTNNANLGLTAPTPPLTFPTKGSQTGDTPTGPIATNSLLKQDTPDAISSVLSKIEQSVRQTSSQTQTNKDQLTASRLQAMKKGAKTDTGRPACEPATGTKVTSSARQTQSVGKGQSKAMARQPVGGKSSVQKKSKQSEIPSFPTNTPTTRKRIADDFLANWVVESVLDPDTSDNDLWGSELKSLNDSLFAASPQDLGQEAFISKDLLARSPEDGGSTASEARVSGVTPAREQDSRLNRSQTQNPDTPQWEQSSPPCPVRTHAPERSSDLFSPAVSSTVDDAFDNVSAASSNAERNQSKYNRLSPVLSPSFLAAGGVDFYEKTSQREYLTSVSSHESGTIAGNWSLESPAPLPTQGGEVLEEQGSIYKNLTRFPGDGQVSRSESPASSLSEDDDTRPVETLSKDSLLSLPTGKSPVLTTKEPSALVDEFITSVGEALIWGDDMGGPSQFANVSGVLTSPVSHTNSNRAKTDVSAREDHENVLVPINDDGLVFMTKVIGNISSHDLLDLDSGDEFMPGLNESFSPIKGGIVVASGGSPCRASGSSPLKGSVTPKAETASPDGRNSFLAGYVPTEELTSPLVSRSPLTANFSPHVSTSKVTKATGPIGPGSAHKSHADDILTQMALLQQRVASVLDNSSEDD